MKARFLKAFNTDLQMYCELMLKDISENSLSYDKPMRLHARWMGMLDSALMIGIIDLKEHSAISDTVMMIWLEAVSARRETWQGGEQC